jgi:hypothetical protein
LKDKKNLCCLCCHHPQNGALPDYTVHRDGDPGGSHYHRGDHLWDSALPDKMVPVHADTNYYVLDSNALALEQGSDMW